MIQDNNRENTDSNANNSQPIDETEKDSSLEALVEQEQTVAREKLSQDLGREPTPAEIDKWLSEQTEGY